MNVRRMALAGLIAIGIIVFYVGNSTTFFGPYGMPGDNLHLFILTASIFVAFLAYLAVVHGRRR